MSHFSSIISVSFRHFFFPERIVLIKCPMHKLIPSSWNSHGYCPLQINPYFSKFITIQHCYIFRSYLLCMVSFTLLISYLKFTFSSIQLTWIILSVVIFQNLILQQLNFDKWYVLGTSMFKCLLCSISLWKTFNTSETLCPHLCTQGHCN